MDVKVGIAGVTPEAGVLIAIEKGYFKDLGLNVTTEPARATAEEIPLLSTGQLSVGIAGPEPALFNAVGRGIPAKFVAPYAVLAKGNAYAGLVVRQDLIDSGQYKGPQDLKGKNIAITALGGTSEFYVHTILQSAGLSNSDVTFQALQLSDMPAAFANKRIDAALGIEPVITALEAQKIAKRVIAIGDIFPSGVVTFVLMSPVFIKDHPDAAQRYMTGFLRGVREYYQAFSGNGSNRAEIVQILTKTTVVKDPKLYDQMVANNGMALVDPNLTMDQTLTSQMQDYYLQQGTQKDRVDLGQLFDNSFATFAVNQLGKV
ncbi:MAG: ABC transporter substrate-binding protein [Chloroflexi bacterium]|nr:ABC transporter substrate-binding protein [Chloroflexota bacterium]